MKCTALSSIKRDAIFDVIFYLFFAFWGDYDTSEARLRALAIGRALGNLKICAPTCPEFKTRARPRRES